METGTLAVVSELPVLSLQGPAAGANQEHIAAADLDIRILLPRLEVGLIDRSLGRKIFDAA
jgi:hypothetical protein